MAILLIFWSIFRDIMANLVLIEFTIGLYIKVTVNARQYFTDGPKTALQMLECVLAFPSNS